MELQEEQVFFESHRAAWLADHRGKFALIKGQRLVDVYDSAESAYIAGVKEFGNVPFLIKQIVEEELIAHLPALGLGILRADL